ncbi:MAG: hypothetical protein U0V75_07965 [Ferruginibacter sp.]
MQNSEFEKSVQASMGSLRLSPSDAVWEQVEASLPPEKKPRRFLFFLLLAALLAGSLFVWNGLYREKQLKGTGKAKQATETANRNNMVAPDKLLAADTVAQLPQRSQEDNVKNTSAAVFSKSLQNSVTKLRVKNAHASEDVYAQDQKTAGEKTAELEPANSNQFKTAGKVNVKVTAPGAVSDSTEIIAAENSATNVIKDDEHQEQVVADASDLVTDDPAITDSNKLKKKNTPSKKWMLGFEAGAGVSYFTGSSARDALVNSSPASIPNPALQNRTASGPFNYQPGFSWGAGLFAKKKLDRHFSLYTGLRYQYLSSSSAAGNRVDTAIRLNFGSSASITANSYYYTGTIKTYSNQFHLLQIPAFIQLKPSRAPGFYAEFGPSVIILLHSNALVFNSAGAVYISHKDTYSKILFSLHAGAGFTAAQRSKWPFETGFSTGYTLSPAIKKDYGKLRSLNGNIYVRMPLRKNRHR